MIVGVNKECGVCVCVCKGGIVFMVRGVLILYDFTCFCMFFHVLRGEIVLLRLYNQSLNRTNTY